MLENGANFENKSLAKQYLNDELNIKNKEVRKLLESTPYKACMPKADTEILSEASGLCLLILKAMKHEYDVIYETNEFLLTKLSSELKDTALNWSSIHSIISEANDMLLRKCKTCDKKKFKRFPFLSIENIREKHLQLKKMHAKAMRKYTQENVRRYPGYPDITEEERNQFKERGSGPDYETMVDVKGDIVPNTRIKKITKLTNENGKWIVTIENMNEEEERVEESNKDQWNRYFGQFAQENQSLLDIMKQRYNEHKKKKDLVKGVGVNTSSFKPEKIKDQISSRNGTTLLIDIKDSSDSQLSQVCFYDTEKQRIYPPLNMSYEKFKIADPLYIAVLNMTEEGEIDLKEIHYIKKGTTRVQVSYKDKERINISKPKSIQHYEDETFDLIKYEKGDVVFQKSNGQYYKIVNKGYNLGFHYDRFMPFNRKLLKIDIRLQNVLIEKSQWYFSTEYADTEFAYLAKNILQTDISPKTNILFIEKSKFKKLMNNLTYNESENERKETILRVCEMENQEILDYMKSNMDKLDAFLKEKLEEFRIEPNQN